MVNPLNEQEKQAFITSLRLLAATPKSRRILKTKLSDKGFDEQVVQRILEKLERQGLLNDRNYALSVMQLFTDYRPSGRRRIAFELEKRGIQKALIQDVIQNYAPEEERQNAFELAKQKWEKWVQFEKGKRRKKVYDFLVRRGFDYTLSREVLEKLEHGTRA